MDTRNIIKLMNNQIISEDEKQKEIKSSLRNINDSKILNQTFQNMTPLMEAAQLGDVVTMKELLAAKAEVNARPESCLMPALHWAAHSGKAQCVELLIEAKAYLNAMDHVNFGLSPLSLAAGLVAKATGDSNACVRLLLVAGAAINSLNPNEIGIPDLYESLSKCNERDELTKLAFKQLLHLNQKEKERLQKNVSGKNTNNWILSKKTLLSEEITHIKIVLGETSDETMDGLVYSDIKKSLLEEPVGMKCLIM